MPIDDDSDDKIRKNLVFSSSLVVLGVWLDINPKTTIVKIFGSDSSNATEAWRVWLAIAALLLYFGMRYRFSVTMEAALEELKSEWRSLVSRLVIATLKNELDNYAKYQKDSLAPSFVIPLSVTFKSNRASNVVPGGAPSKDPISINPKKAAMPFQGIVSFDSSWSDHLKIKNFYQLETEFKIKTSMRLSLTARVLAQMTLYSKSSTSLLAPVALNAAALIICAIQILRNLP